MACPSSLASLGQPAATAIAENSDKDITTVTKCVRKLQEGGRKRSEHIALLDNAFSLSLRALLTGRFCTTEVYLDVQNGGGLLH